MQDVLLKSSELKQQLFGSIAKSILTLGSLYFLYLTIPPILQWAVFDANWLGNSATDCKKDGACWLYVKAWFKQFLYGSYPTEEIWRLKLCFIVFGIFIAVIAADKWISLKVRKYFFLTVIFLFPLLAIILMYGGFLGLPVVPTRYWGGLFLTLVIAIFGILTSFPIGIFLALGRMSKMRIVRYFCICFIELWRGVPLITVLFMASVMFPLFMPEGVNVDSLLRVLVGVSLFAGAYMAEIIRGGLQAIPKGQYEASKALGLGYWRSMFLVILPQAVTIVIPGIVSAFISLTKETTLVYIIGLNDFLAMVDFTTSNPDWIPYTKEGYVFVAIVFWIICYSMSSYSKKLEYNQSR